MDKAEAVLNRGIVNIIPSKDKLKKLLNSGEKLNVYLGIDPTATRIHLGNAVPLRKLQEFVELGHNVTFLIGDFTALIGDTSDKESERPVLTYKEIKENFKTYKKQAEKIVNFSKAKVKFNSEWLKKLTFTDVVKLTQHFSVGDFVSRELIKKRLDSGKKVGLHEFLYPVMQGYDSYLMDTDIQIGGADQTFNMQAGRVLQKDLRKKESFVLVTGYLEGTDGRKMSKSWGNAIWVEDQPREMYGKVMSVRDNLIESYFTLATGTPVSEIKKIVKGDTLTAKKRLAFEIVKMYHSGKKAQQAQRHFEQTFQKGKPEFKRTVKNQRTLLSTIAQVLKTRSEAKRLIAQKAVDIDGRTIADPNYEILGGEKIKIGKKIFLKVN